MYYFIINPASRSGQAETVWNQVKRQLKTKRVEYRAYFTRHPDDARKYARRLTADKEEATIVVVGGDGTLNEVVNGICEFSTVTLGFIPTGSSNDFSRALGIPSDPERALLSILSGKRTTRIDVGQITVDKRSRLFLVSAGIGLDAAICQQAAVSRLKAILNRLKLGRLTYALLALQQLFLCRPSRMMIAADGKTYRYERAYLAAIMNLPYEGGGCMFAPKADCRDDHLDLCVVEGLGKLKILLLLPTIFSGNHVRFRGVHMIRCRSVAIASQSRQVVHTDGETTPPKRALTASCSGKQLRIVY